MKVEILRCLSDNFSYLVIDEKNRDACIIDPSESSSVIKFLENKKINLKFILNTHHHADHVDGNIELKNKYKAKVIGFIDDKNRIPGIDICLKNKEIWKDQNFEFQTFHIPGHTSGHICYYFFKEKLLFTGDTLFSLGCGRIFEGTYKQMFNSLNLIKSFPKETLIFCGHEYTKSNYNFCVAHDKKNRYLKEKSKFIELRLKNNLPTIPVKLSEEINCNIFLRCADKQIKSSLGLDEASEFEVFKKLRDLKDAF